jgi:hypothetical protein
MNATKSRTLPPTRPPRAAAHEPEWQAHAFFSVLTMKLCLLFFDAWFGKGHCPRK